MKILLACDKFKGSLSSKEVASFIQKGFRATIPEAIFTSRAIADGGEGFTNSLVDSKGGALQTAIVEDALGRKVEAEWGIIPTKEEKYAAVIEMATASGLWRTKEEERDIMQASTYGTGELIKIAAQTEGVEHIYLGLGGSATNDGGVGMAQALGLTFANTEGRITPSSLLDISKADLSTRIPLPPITVACDVDNPLCGENGASAIFGPQKGATPEQIPVLDALLHHLAEVTDPSLATTPGAGAAGGLGFGMMAFTGAQLVSGFDLVANALDLESAVAEADIVITGEGGLDAQSLSGKGPIGVAKLAKKHGKTCLAIAGKISPDVDWSPYFQHTAALVDTGVPITELIENTEIHLVKLATELSRKLLGDF